MSKIEPGQGLGRGKGRATVVDDEDVAQLYVEQRWKTSRIARKYGVTEMTIYRSLKRSGIAKRYGRGGEECRSGHPRSVWGHKNADGKWRCRKCEGRDTPLYILYFDGMLVSIHSTPDLAQAAGTGDWSVISPEKEWVSTSGYTVSATELDPDA